MSRPTNHVTNPVLLAQQCGHANGSRLLRQLVGKRMARKRLLQHQQNQNNGRMNRVNTCNAHQVIYRRSAENMDMSVDPTQQYTACAFLDQHDVVLAAGAEGEIDVLKLPRHFADNDQEEDGSNNIRLPSWNTAKVVKLAGRLQLETSASSYDDMPSLSAKYKLESLQQGQAFAVGNPNGTFSVFATEHASTWGNRHWSTRSSKVLHQDRISVGSQQPSNEIRPLYISQGWSMGVFHQLQQREQETRAAYTAFSSFGSYSSSLHDFSRLGHRQKQDWWITPYSDALWAFRETPSAVMAARVRKEMDGRCRCVQVMDGRTINQQDADNSQQAFVLSLDIDIARSSSSSSSSLQHSNDGFVQEGITAVCFASEYNLFTAHARIHDNKDVDNLIKLWDLRSMGTSVHEMLFQPPSASSVLAAASSNSDPSNQDYIAYLTPSVSLPGSVLVTSVDKGLETLQHTFCDWGRQKVLPKTIVLPLQSTSAIFAVTPSHDCLATHEEVYQSTGQRVDAITLYDVLHTTSPTLTNGARHSVEQSQRTNKKTAVPLQATNANNTGWPQMQATAKHCGKRSHSRSKGDFDTALDSETSTSTISSNSNSGSDARRGDDNARIPIMGKFRPKLTDRWGLSTSLTAMAINDCGTIIIGGTHDGDLFAWSGS